MSQGFGSFVHGRAYETRRSSQLSSGGISTGGSMIGVMPPAPPAPPLTRGGISSFGGSGISPGVPADPPPPPVPLAPPTPAICGDGIAMVPALPAESSLASPHAHSPNRTASTG